MPYELPPLDFTERRRHEFYEDPIKTRQAGVAGSTVQKKQELPPIPTNLLVEGQAEAQRKRAEIFTQTLAEQDRPKPEIEYANSEEGLMSSVTNFFAQNTPEGVKAAGAKFLKVIEPLKYIDIPVELGMEAIEGGIDALLPGQQQFWTEGTAERENMEGWKSLGNMLQGKISLYDMAEEVSAAFEKRPLLVQVASGVVYGGAVGQIGKIQKLGKFAKPLMYTLDPAQAIFDVASVGVRAGYRQVAPKKIDDMLELMNTDLTSLEDFYRKNLEEITEAPKGTWKPGNPLSVRKLAKGHKVYNSLVRLRRLLSDNTGDVAGEMAIEDDTLTTLVKQRDLALIDLEQASFGRPGHIENMSFKDLQDFAETGMVSFTQKEGKTARTRRFMIADPQKMVVAYHSVGKFLKSLEANMAPEEWAKLQNQNAKPFHAVHVPMENNLPKADLEGPIIGVGAFKQADEDVNLVLTDRFRYYNEMDALTGGNRNLPEAAQFLRSLAATVAVTTQDATPNDIRAMLLHSAGSGDLWQDYVWDADGIDVSESSKFLFGSFEMGVDAQSGKLVDTVATGGYLERVIGLKPMHTVIRRGVGQEQYIDGQLVVNESGDRVYGIKQDAKLFEKKGKLGEEIPDTLWNKVRESFKVFALARGIGRGATDKMQRKGMVVIGNPGSKEYAGYVDAIGQIRIEQIRAEGYAGISDAFIKDRYDFVERTAGATADGIAKLDWLVEYNAVLRYRDEAIEATKAHMQVNMKRDLVKKNLIDSGWAKTTKTGVGLRLLNKQDPEKAAEWIRRHGEGSAVTYDEAYRMFGPHVDDKGMIRTIPDAGTSNLQRTLWESKEYQENIVQSYTYLSHNLRKTAGHLETHEIMVSGAYNAQQVLRNKMSILRSMEDIGPLHPDSVYFDPLIAGALDDGLRHLPAEARLVPKREGVANTDWEDAIAYVENSGFTSLNASAIRNAARKPLLEIVMNDNSLEGIERLTRHDPKSSKGVEAIKDWLGIGRVARYVRKDAIEANRKAMIVQALARKGLNSSSTLAEMNKSLAKAFKSTPQLFGMDIRTLAVDDARVVNRIEAVANILFQNPRMLQEAGVPVRNVILDAGAQDVMDEKWVRYIGARRAFIENYGATFDGVQGKQFASAYAAPMPTVEQNTSLVALGTEGRFGRKVLGIGEDGQPNVEANYLQLASRGVWTALSGGKAMAGMRTIARHYNGWRIAYENAQGEASRISGTLHHILATDGKLGFMTEDATGKMKQAQDVVNIAGKKLGAQGQQYFSKVKVRQVKFSDDGLQVIEWADGFKMEEDTLNKLNRCLEAVTMPNADSFGFMHTTGNATDDFYKLMTQVDVVMDEIPYSRWSEVYELTPHQRNQLMMMQNISAELDKLAESYGVSIRELIERDKGTYKPQGSGYLTRMRMQTAAEEMNKRDNPDMVKHNDKWWTKNRADESFFDFITSHGDDIGDNVMMDMPQRIAMYAESIHKTIADKQLNDFLHKHSNATNFFKQAANNKYNVRALKDVLQARLTDPTVLGVAAGKRAAHLVEANISSLPEELQLHIENMVLNPHRFNQPGNTQLYNNPEMMFDMGEVAQGAEALGKPVVLTPNQQANQYAAVYKDDILRAIEDVDAEYDTIMQQTVHLKNSFTGGKLDLGNEMWLDHKKINAKRTDKITLNDEDFMALKEYVSVAQEGMQQILTTPAKALRGYSRTARTFKAGFDFGVLLIHGFNAMITLPAINQKGIQWTGQKAWGKAAWQMGKYIVNPDHHAAYMASDETLKLINETRGFLTLGHSEPLAAVQNSNSFLRWRRALADTPVGGLRIADRAETAFVGTLDVLRLELYKGMKDSVVRDYDKMATVSKLPAWEDNAAKMSGEQRIMMQELGSAINKMTGVYNASAAGYTPSHNVIENSLLFFAPMYRRATYGVLADLFRKGGPIKGKEGTNIRFKTAFRQLAGLVTAGFIVSSIAEHMFGMKDGANPNSGNFGKFEIMDTKVGIGTAWYSLMRLTADIASNAELNPEGDAGEFLKDHPIITAFGRRGRSMLAPAGAGIIDIWTGSTYSGDPLRDGMDFDVKALGQNYGRQHIPFWIDGAWSGGFGWGGVTQGGAELLGFQAWGLSEWDNLSKVRQSLLENDMNPEVVEWRNEQLRKGKPLVWDALPDAVENKLAKTQDYVIAENAYRIKSKSIARGESEQWNIWFDKSAQINRDAMAEAQRLAYLFETGRLSGPRYQQELRIAKANRSSAKQMLFQDEAIRDVAAKIEAYKRSNSDIPDSEIVKYEGDILWYKYGAEVVDNAENYDAFGDLMYDEWRKSILGFKTRHNLTETGRTHLWEYIETRQQEWYNDNPIMMDLDASKKVLEPYWGVYNQLEDQTERNLAKAYYNTPTSFGKKSLVARYPEIPNIVKKVNNMRIELRENNPIIDMYIVKYHDGTPRTDTAAVWQQSNAFRQQQLISTETKQEGSAPYSTLAVSKLWDRYKITDAYRVIYD